MNLTFLTDAQLPSTLFYLSALFIGFSTLLAVIDYKHFILKYVAVFFGLFLIVFNYSLFEYMQGRPLDFEKSVRNITKENTLLQMYSHFNGNIYLLVKEDYRKHPTYGFITWSEDAEQKLKEASEKADSEGKRVVVDSSALGRTGSYGEFVRVESVDTGPPKVIPTEENTE